MQNINERPGQKVARRRRSGRMILACAAAIALAFPVAAQARDHGGGGHGGGHAGGFHGGHFHGAAPVARGGGWHGRGGWGGWGWGGIGLGLGLGYGGWYGGYPYYDGYYGPAASYWYYCPNPPGYYPYVTQCYGPWQPVPAG